MIGKMIAKTTKMWLQNASTIDLIHDFRHLCHPLGLMSNRGRVYLFSENEKTFILVLENVQFEFRQVLHYYGLLSEHLRCLYHIQKGNNKHFHPKFSIIVFLIKKTSSFSFFKSKQFRPRFRVLTTTENTITYHNALCLCYPKILHKHCLQFLLGVEQQRALWYAMVFSVALN